MCKNEENIYEISSPGQRDEELQRKGLMFGCLSKAVKESNFLKPCAVVDAIALQKKPKCISLFTSL